MFKNDRPSRLSRRTLISGSLAGAGLAVSGLAVASSRPDATAAPAQPDQGGSGRGRSPLVVLVHGAFADAGSWSGVIEILHRRGLPVVAPANPLRNLETDAAYVASVVSAVSAGAPEPEGSAEPVPVVLVGHSYGGAVITNAARSVPNVRALVYVSAFAPDTGETLASLNERFPKTPLADAVRPQQFPLPDGSQGTEVYIDQARFDAVFAADVPAHRAAVLAATQRPIADAAMTVASGEPAWRSLPSWYLVSRQDAALHPEAQRFFADRMRATDVVEVDSSHAAVVAHPGTVADLIRAATQAIQG